MLGSLRMTVVLLAVLALTVISSALSLRSQKQSQPPRPPGKDLKERLDKQKKKEEGLRSQFPVVDYDAPDEPDPVRRSKRKEKNTRFDKRNLVSEDPTTRITEAARISEGYDVPALPTSQSGLIITGEVLTSQAHISNDKHGVYTELTVRVDEVIKNVTPLKLASGDVVTAEREGGIVRYSNGHRRLHHIADEGMPVVARRYVLFLRATEDGQDFYVLTGYELSDTGISAVDAAPRFTAYEGYEPDAFLTAVRSSVKQSQQTPNN